MTEVALVTGGAGRIGRAIVERLAQEGYAVAIHCHESRDEAEALAEVLRRDGVAAAVLAFDLADPTEVDGLVPAAESALGPVTLLVNNAASFVPDEVHALDVPTWNRQFSINLRAPSVLAGAVSNRLPTGLEGCVVNIVDQRVWRLSPQYYSYTLTKSALLTATVTMAQALAPRMRVNAVGPGPTLPNRHEGESRMAAEIAGSLLRRRIEPREIADAVLYLARARGVTGQMLAVDSGQHLGWSIPVPLA